MNCGDFVKIWHVACLYFVELLKTRDETIRSSHDTIRIDTLGNDLIIYDTIWVVIVKIQAFTIFTFFYL